jgi:hypothetical protein
VVRAIGNVGSIGEAEEKLKLIAAGRRHGWLWSSHRLQEGSRGSRTRGDSVEASAAMVLAPAAGKHDRSRTRGGGGGVVGGHGPHTGCWEVVFLALAAGVRGWTVHTPSTER